MGKKRGGEGGITLQKSSSLAAEGRTCFGARWRRKRMRFSITDMKLGIHMVSGVVSRAANKRKCCFAVTGDSGIVYQCSYSFFSR